MSIGFPRLSKAAFSVIAVALLLPSSLILGWIEFELLSANRGLDATHLFSLWGISSTTLGWVAFWGLLRNTGLPSYARLLDLALLIAIAGQLLPVFRAFSSRPPADAWFMFIWPILGTWFLYAVLQRGGLKGDLSDKSV